jgi:hypothetical protein
VALVQDQPLLLAALSSNAHRRLILFGQLGAAYQLQYKTNLAMPRWIPWLDYTQTNVVQTLDLENTNPVIYYRVSGLK